FLCSSDLNCLYASIYAFVNFRSFFVFSSRRRHTRFSRDWSSDVCSSDLCPSKRLSGRYAQTAVWTGSEMVVWGGTDDFTYFNTEIGRASCRERVLIWVASLALIEEQIDYHV